jgi:hypothetical protein
MSDHKRMKLGRRPVRLDRRTLRLAKYIDVAKLPPNPPERDWTKSVVVPWGMMRNDEVGDCTFAACAHAVQVWSANNGQEVTISDDDIIKAYSALTGYTPRDPSSDQGAVVLDVLNYFRQNGIGGHKIGAYVAVDPKNKTHVAAAINLFGVVYYGLALPLSAQGQKTWKVPWYGKRGKGKPGTWGGHAVVGPTYAGKSGKVVTWGELQSYDWGFEVAYAEEAYALLSPDWVLPDKKAPSGFDLGALQSDLSEVAR